MCIMLRSTVLLSSLVSILAFVIISGCQQQPVRSVLVQTSPSTVELRGERVVVMRFIEEAKAECERRGTPDMRSTNECFTAIFKARLSEAMLTPPSGCQAVQNDLVCDTDQYRISFPITPSSLAPTSAFGRAKVACEARNLRWGDNGYQACLDRELMTSGR